METSGFFTIAEISETHNILHTQEIAAKLKKLTIGIAGLGGLSNLNRQAYFLEHVGMYKTEAIADIIHRINPFISIELNRTTITSENCMKLFENVSPVIEAVDGGLIAFTFNEHTTRAALCALDIRAALPVFNIRPDLPIKDNISLRLALDTGKIKFASDTGHIVSDVINYAAHLEKSGTLPGEISISENIKKELSPKVAKVVGAATQGLQSKSWVTAPTTISQASAMIV